MQISEIAERVGTSAKTIRYYESIGVLPEPARLSNGYRTYGAEDEQRLRVVTAARSLGLGIDDVRVLTEVAAAGEPVCERLSVLVADHLIEIRATIEELEQLETRLHDVLVDAESVDRRTVDDHSTMCPVLDQR